MVVVDLHLGGQRGFEQMHGFVDDVPEVQGRVLAFALAAEGEDLRDQFAGTFGGVQDTVEKVLYGMIVGEFAAGEVGMAEDAGEEVVEVVRDATGESANGFHLLCLKELCFEVFALGFGLLARGDVTEDKDAVVLIVGVGFLAR